MLSQMIKNVKKEKQQKENKENVVQNESNNLDEQNSQQQNQILEQNLYSNLESKNLEQYKVKCDYKTLYYFPDYLTEKDKEILLKNIYAQNESKWEVLPKANRRLQKWGGDVTPQGVKNKENLPQFFQVIADKLHYGTKIIDKMPNHVLLNEYPAQVGIMPHTDGPLYYNFVCSISLLSDCLFKFYKDYESFKKKEFLTQILVEDGCLSCFSEDLYKNYLHCIEDIGIEYVYIQIEDDQENGIKIVKSNVANFEQTKKYQQLSSFKSIQDAVDQGFLLAIKKDNEDQQQKQQQKQQNSEYNYAIEIQRKKRISLTIRNVE